MARNKHERREIMQKLRISEKGDCHLEKSRISSGIRSKLLKLDMRLFGKIAKRGTALFYSKVPATCTRQLGVIELGVRYVTLHARGDRGVDGSSGTCKFLSLTPTMRSDHTIMAFNCATAQRHRPLSVQRKA